MLPKIIFKGVEPVITNDSFGCFERHEYHFLNGYGASVVCNEHSHGLELAVLEFVNDKWNLCYTTPITHDVVKYISGEEELSNILTRIYNLQGKQMDDNINKPAYYNKGSVDLIESWYRTYPWSQFVAIMESHIDKYVKRHRYKDNALQDLDKAIVYIERLKYYTSIRLEEEDE